jgi:predicted dehydrogenase
MTKMSRRDFLKVSAAGGMCAGVFSSLHLATGAKVLGANEDIRVACVGLRGKGGSHIQAFSKMSGVRLVALCDADKKVLGGRVAECEKAGVKAQSFVDIRKLLEMKDLDAIVVATPNHWHSLATVWACQAGKDVYVEKPVSHNIFEGRKAVEAARKYNRIVQGGTQKRSDSGLKAVFDFMRGGGLGKILWARGLCYKPRGHIGKVNGPQTVPESVDYDLWCGPAPKGPLMRKNLHYDWHWFWDTGNADIGNQGIHEMDLCRWAVGQDGPAPKAFSIGGRFVHDDDAETPNTQIAFLDYQPAPVIFEVRGLPTKKGLNAMDNYRSGRVDVVIQCEDGHFMGDGGSGWVYDKDGKKVRQFKGDGGESHQNNFIKAVRSRKQSDLNADIELGHLSAILVHQANISYRLGKEKRPEEVLEAIKGNKEMRDSYERFLKHLEANEVDLKKAPVTLGPVLQFDPQAERFTGEFSDEANKLVSRAYREPFVVPEKV